MYNEDAFRFISEQIGKTLESSIWPHFKAINQARYQHISAALTATHGYRSMQDAMARAISANTPDISAVMRANMPDISGSLTASMPDFATLTPGLGIAKQANLISQTAIKGISTEIMKSLNASLASQRAGLFNSVSGFDFGALSVATARRMAEQEAEGEFTEEDAHAAVEFGEDAAPGWSDRIRDLTGDVKDRAVELLPAAAAVVLWVLTTFVLLVLVGVLNNTEALMTMHNVFAGLVEGLVTERVLRIIKASSEAVKEKNKDPDEIE